MERSDRELKRGRVVLGPHRDNTHIRTYICARKLTELGKNFEEEARVFFSTNDRVWRVRREASVRKLLRHNRR